MERDCSEHLQKGREAGKQKTSKCLREKTWLTLDTKNITRFCKCCTQQRPSAVRRSPVRSTCVRRAQSVVSHGASEGELAVASRPTEKKTTQFVEKSRSLSLLMNFAFCGCSTLTNKKKQ